MIIPDSHSPAQLREKRLQFDRYVLDLARGCLLLDGSEIALRPKTFAVLHYLAENCGRLVSKEELFAAVWPKLVVTDDALVQSVGELRRALGDDGSRLIKTIPRRGYRFESAVSVAPSIPQSSASVTPGSTASPDEAQSEQSVASGPTLVRFFRTASARLRIGLFAALTLAVVSVAAILWSSVGDDWTSRNVLGRIGLSTTTRPEPGAKTAIAILPFRNESNDSTREYFAQGLTQDIINALGRFPELTVMSWNAVYPYKERPASPGEIARDLAVQYQVEGSVFQTNDRIRVIAQLVSADGRVLWSDRFDSALADLFALQGKMTTDIAGALAIRVTKIEEQRVLAKPAENLEAYDYVLRARPALQRPTRANNVEARALLRHAIEIDPNSAAAYAALAETYQVAVVMGWAESPAESLGRAGELANKALSLDSSQVRAHVTLGRIHLFYHRYEQADAELQRAIAINPNDAYALAGHGNVLMWSGQTDAAVEALEQAQRIDPELNAIDRNALSLAYYLERRYDRAVEEAERNLREAAAANFSRVVLAAAYAQHGRMEDAARVVMVIHRTDPTFDPRAFGSKFLKPADLEHLRDGFRKAGLLPDAPPTASGK